MLHCRRQVLSGLAAGGGSLERTRLWGTNSLLPGKIQGISPIPGLRAPRRQRKAHEISFLRANSLRTLTGNFLRPCRELNRAIREVSAEIRESRFRPLFGIRSW